MVAVSSITSSPIASAAGTVIVIATAGVIVEIYRRRKQQQDDVKKWYQTALGIVSRVQKVGYQATEYQRTDYEAVRSKLDPLAGDLQEHAACAPEEVPDDSRQKLHFLAAFCTGLIALSEEAQEVDPIEFLQTIQENAQESYDGEYTIDMANDFIEPINTENIIDNLPAEEIETNNEAINDFLDAFDEDSVEQSRVQSIDEALEMPLEMLNEMLENEDIWGEMIGETMREYTRLIVITVTEEFIETMEKRKQQV